MLSTRPCGAARPGKLEAAPVRHHAPL